jgi:glycopeptide antibiotics resistance protein
VHFETYGLFVGLALCLFVVDSAGKRHLGSGQVLAACLVAIAAMTLVPLHGPERLELRPGDAAGVGDIANLLLFAPLGGVLYLRRWSAAQAIGTAFALSLAIELFQRVIPGRTTSTDDVLFNTLGTALGWLLARRFSSRFTG